jgi:hypothetical protein
VNIQPDKGSDIAYDMMVYKNFSSSSAILKANSPFNVTVGLTNQGYGPFPEGTAGIALTNSSGDIVEVIGTASVDILRGSYNLDPFNVSCSVSSSVQPGDYKLKVAVKHPANDEWEILTGRVDCSSSSIPVRMANDNADLSSLSVTPGELSPEFNAGITSYTVNVADNIKRINIEATPANNKAKLTGATDYWLDAGENNIQVVVTAENGTTKKSYDIKVLRGILSGEVDNVGMSSLKAYPVPVSGNITVTGLGGSGVLTVFDAVGKQWIKRNIVSEEEIIDVAPFPSGIYFIQTVEGKNIKTVKILVK